ncbi:hypothetical protein [Nocardia huaxiensis]|uniref:hypothetical protein n=1 Tax=Nocardia huaxiensis TaxID=2755382 RepID=UPI001E65CAAE|nr:hypothetical protein [Nocardia huaxiensis]UFS95491.1 hypothetical protein LPY97_33250 [Nocardia huaxiensis]
MGFDVTGKSIDEILDYGAPGLQYWEQFLPLYEKAFGPLGGGVLTELQARYDEQRRTDLAGLDSARTELEGAVAEADIRWVAQQGVVSRLPSMWQGGAGDRALGIADAQLRQARDVVDTARAAVTVIGDAAGPLRSAALAKAEHTLGLLEQSADGTRRIAIGGKTPEEIEALIADTESDWLTDTFKLDVECKLDGFTAACATADDCFETQYRSILTALNQTPDQPYPYPDDSLVPRRSDIVRDPETSRIPAETGAGGAVSPAASSPGVATFGSAPGAGGSLSAAGPQPEIDSAGTTYGSGPVAGNAPSGVTAPAAETESAQAAGRPEPETPGSPASAPVDSAGSTVPQGITDILDKLGELISGAVSTLTSGDLSPSGNSQPETDPQLGTEPQPGVNPQDSPPNTAGKTEFDIAGRHVTLEPTPDGGLSLVVTDESGESRTFAVTFDENGNPVVTEGESEPGAEAPPAAEPAANCPGEPPTALDSSPANPEVPEANPEAPSEDADSPAVNPECPPVDVEGPAANPDVPPVDPGALPQIPANDPPGNPQPGVVQAPEYCPPAAPPSDAPADSVPVPPSVLDNDPTVEIPDSGTEIPDLPEGEIR